MRKSTRKPASQNQQGLRPISRIQDSVNTWIKSAIASEDDRGIMAENFQMGLMVGLERDQAGVPYSAPELFPEARWNDDGALSAGYAFAWRSMQNCLIAEHEQRLVQAFDACESPIEQYFLSAFIGLCEAHSLPFVLLPRRPSTLVPQEEGRTGRVWIEPQCAVGKFRVDYLLTYQCEMPDWDRLDDNGGAVALSGRSVVVECDGFEYHENATAAGRDRERSNFLQGKGFRVLRYTGSQLNQDPAACAADALRHLTTL